MNSIPPMTACQHKSNSKKKYPEALSVEALKSVVDKKSKAIAPVQTGHAGPLKKEVMDNVAEGGRSSQHQHRLRMDSEQQTDKWRADINVAIQRVDPVGDSCRLQPGHLDTPQDDQTSRIGQLLVGHRCSCKCC